MLNKFFITLFIFFSIFFNLQANEKKLIINRLIGIDNITFDFQQTSNNKTETGTCILVFDNKLKCDYEDSSQKRILINNKTLVVQQKRYDKKFFYPVSNSPLIKIFNKNNLLDLIEKSDYKLNDNIELSYTDENNKKIVIFFKKNNYDLVGWRIVDQLQNIVNFYIKIKYVNSEVSPEIFLIPSVN